MPEIGPKTKIAAGVVAGAMAALVGVRFVGDFRPECSLDIDGDGHIAYNTDGTLLMRYVQGVRGPDLVEGAIPVETEVKNTTPEAVLAQIEKCVGAYDLDGDGKLSEDEAAAIYQQMIYQEGQEGGGEP